MEEQYLDPREDKPGHIPTSATDEIIPDRARHRRPRDHCLLPHNLHLPEADALHHPEDSLYNLHTF